MNKGSLAISTSWNSNTNADIKEMLSQIKGAGLDAIELGYNFTPQRLRELISLAEAMKIKVVSVHNFCPMPPKGKGARFATDYYRLSSLDEQERRQAVDFTKGSVDTARSVSAEAVIVHAGTVEMEHDYSAELLNLYNSGKFDCEEFRRARERLLAERRRKSPAYLESAKKSLEEILSYTQSAGIKIGLETRYYPNEIPNIQEAEYLLNIFKGRGLVYWHDVGHAQTSERLGITAHRDYLDKFADCMLGVHLHDLKGIDDHMAPFSGDLDWAFISAYMRDGLIKVIEAHPPATAGQIKESVKKLSGAFNLSV